MPITISGATALVGDRLIPDTTIAIDGDRITAIGQAVGRGTTIDARGWLALPGIVDLHADAIERAVEPRPGVRVPLPVALAEHDAWLLAAGITTCFVSLTDGFEPGVRSRETVRLLADALREQAPLLATRTPLHLRREVCAAGDADELAQWLCDGRIGLLSINDHLPAGDDPEQEARFVASLRRRLNGHAGGLERLVDEARARRADGIAISDRLCAIACGHAIPVAAHDDATPEAAEASVARGACIAEFPADLATARRARGLGATVLLGAPNAVRGSSHVGWMSAADAIAVGACDALCSDYHHPSLFHAPFALANRGVCDLASAWNLVSRGPAAAAGLRDRGRVATGCLADLILVEPMPRPRIRSVFVGGREVAHYA